MSPEALPEVREQREYYDRTANEYNSMHVNPTDEHGRALSAFMGLAELFGPVDSVLDVGAGTGRALKKIKDRWPNSKVVGVEPVDALREVGHKSGLLPNQLVSGNALDLKFADNSFDYVIETGALHHIPCPSAAVKEMVRVAKKGVMISDNNNLAEGAYLARVTKYLLKRAGLWRTFIYLQTGGKMYKVSEGDGVYYSFSSYDYVDILTHKFVNIHYMNTSNSHDFNIYRSAQHVMIFATNQ
jgi:ubiquinone/menaquinone biosynthesis C-methylase UbiE